MNTKMAPFGIVAGEGRFPILLAHSVKSSGTPLAVIALKEEASHEIESIADSCEWVSLGKLDRMIEFFRSRGVQQAVMAGRVKHTRIFSHIFPDWRAVRVMSQLPNRKTDTILSAVAKEFAKEGVELVSSISHLKPFLSEKGLMSGKNPSRKILEDIKLGQEVCLKLGGMDLGQTVCVKDKAVLSIEAMEGTNEAMIRAGRLCGGGFVIVKMAKPSQDFRFDVPVVGLDTLRVLKESKAALLAIEAEKTLILDKPEFLSRARQDSISILGI